MKLMEYGFLFILLRITIWVEQGLSVRLRDEGHCNMTILGSEFVGNNSGSRHLRLIPVRNRMVSFPLYCRYDFLGEPGQAVLIQVKSFLVGNYDTHSQSCEGGAIRLWDGLPDVGRHLFPANEICGQYQGTNIRKISTGRIAAMEFITHRAFEFMDFHVNYKFIDIELEKDLYREQMVNSLHVDKTSGSTCTFKAALADCQYEECQVISPGYPGIYAPNNECYYHVTSHDPHIALQVLFHGVSSTLKERIFDLKNSDDCTSEYLAIYDGPDTSSPLIAKFCDTRAANILTSGHNVYVMFSSTNDVPPFQQGGFHFSVIGFMKEWNPHGERWNDTLCDWWFEAADGSLSSPEHWLPPHAKCTYTFDAQPGHVMHFIFHIYRFESSCRDKLVIEEPSSRPVSLCEENRRLVAARAQEQGKQEGIHYTSRSATVDIVYSTERGQYQSDPDHGFWLSFRQVPAHTDEGDTHYTSYEDTEDPYSLLGTASTIYQNRLVQHVLLTSTIFSIFVYS